MSVKEAGRERNGKAEKDKDETLDDRGIGGVIALRPDNADSDLFCTGEFAETPLAVL